MHTDFHTHILPGIDDGSKNIEESLLLLRMQEEEGIERIIATPHFYAYEDNVDRFLDRRKRSFARLKEALGSQESPEILLGAEVYYFRGIGKAEMLPHLCIEGTSILLLEMPFTQWDDSMYRDISYIVKDRKITVVLAHIERYMKFQKDFSTWNYIMSLPSLYKQMNGGCFLDWMRRRAPLRYVRDGHRIILGSDCHNTKTRVPNLVQANEVLKKKTGRDILGESDQLLEELLTRAAI